MGDDWDTNTFKTTAASGPSYTGDEEIDHIIGECLRILKVKGDDYTIGTGDRLHNFRTVAEFTGQRMEEVLGVYLYKHIAAVFAYIKSGGQSESEPIAGRISDVIVYMLLFYKMVVELETARRLEQDEGIPF